MTKLVSYAHKHNRNMRFIAPKEAKLPSWAVDIQDYSEEPMPEIPNMSELASWKADAISLLGEKVKAEKERDKLFEVAKYCELLLMKYEFNRIDGDEISEHSLAYIREVIAEIGRG